MLAEAGEDLADERMAQNPRDDARLSVGFSDLAPETLGRIMEDCERFQHPKIGASDWTMFDANTGGDFWRDRQGRQLTRYSTRLFPPLTPYLGDDGKVYLREGV